MLNATHELLLSLLPPKPVAPDDAEELPPWEDEEICIGQIDWPTASGMGRQTIYLSPQPDLAAVGIRMYRKLKDGTTRNTKMSVLYKTLDAWEQARQPKHFRELAKMAKQFL